MEKENICFFRRRRKKRQIVREGKGVKIFGKGKKFFAGRRTTEKEKEENMFLWRKRKAEKEKEENIWKRKNFLGEEKGGKHLETENEENFWRNKIYF